MKMKRLLSALLAVIMAVGSIGVTSVVTVNAAWEDKVDDNGDPLINYVTKEFETAQLKLDSMVLKADNYGCQIYYEEFTGEVAFVNKSTGEALFTNPYDLANTNNKASNSTKQQLLSQIILSYEDNGSTKEMNSYVDAALRGQITAKPIKNGVRVEYTMGEEAVTRLVPRLIIKERFEELILNQISDEWLRGKVKSYYDLKDPFAADINERILKEMQAKFPITKKYAVYICDENTNAIELRRLEGWIKQNCPNYNYEELEYDHELTGYVGSDAAPPLFKLALEYSILEDGTLEVRLPANGIRFDETAYTLKDITVLPYMGAGNSNNTGYTFVPDGSGALVRFEDVQGQNYNLSGQLYGHDYAYHKLSGQHAETWRWPVFGVVTNYKNVVSYDKVVTPSYTDENGKVVAAVTETVVERFDEDRGYFAIITEGDSLATLMTAHGGKLHWYNSIYAKFTPRPSDTYSLQDSVSIASETSWTVASERKYTGSYRIKYFLLSDADKAAAANLTDYYDCNYYGMAAAYRDYLLENGILTRLGDDDVKEDTPLFIESFGSTETQEKILSFPVTVDLALTTFEDVKTMYDQLAEKGITNVNFRLTGFANGGLESTVPYKLEWAKALGGKEGFEDLVAYAQEKGFGIFPDFDFVYANSLKDELFDGFSTRSHAVKTIDNRYTTRREYSAAYQTFKRTTMVAISASVFDHFYSELTKNYIKYNNPSISVSTLGTDLNSDFDEDDPYNREDSKSYTIKLLEQISKDYENVMIDGGNAYALKYADYILNTSTTSSQYVKFSEAIPFIGIVLHGSTVSAGEPINMEGDVDMAMLQAIENGSYLYFTLSYRNTQSLKDNESLQKYYSVDFNIWFDDVVEKYNILNEATKDLQDKLIVGHDFVTGYRVPEDYELENDLQAAIEAQLALDKKAQVTAEKAALKKLLTQLHNGEIGIKDKADVKEEITTPSVMPSVSNEADKYATSAGSVVIVTYEGGVRFVLNKNSFEITVNVDGTTYTIGALDFIRLD